MARVKAGAAGLVPPQGQIIVRGPARGRWRAGRHFGADPVALDLAALDPVDLAAIQADPLLIVTTDPDGQTGRDPAE